MKINEKILASYATSSSTAVDLSGWLLKRGEVSINSLLYVCRPGNSLVWHFLSSFLA
jgi:hypothetical protein